MGIVNLLRTGLPRGNRPPGPVVNAHIDGSGNWWGPTWNALPFSSDGSVEPTIINTGWDAESASMAIPAAWRALNMIAGPIAQMPLGLHDRLTSITNNHMSSHMYGDHSKLHLQVLDDPWPLITYYNWMFMCVCSLVLRGNFYALRYDYDEATNWPRQLLPVHVDDVTIEIKDGYPLYKVEGFSRMFDWTDMFHIRGFMMPGMIKGIGVIEAHRAGLSDTRVLMDFGAGSYRSGGVPPVILTVDKPEITEQEAEYLQARWVQRHTPTDRRPAVVPKIVKIDQVGLSMQDAEYLESRQFSISEIAYMFNLDPNDLSAGFARGGNSMTYQNMETRMQERLIFSLQMWISRIEQAFSQIVPGSTIVKMNTEEILRADTMTRYQGYAIALSNKILTINEVRAKEGRPPVEGGDDVFNNATLTVSDQPTRPTVVPDTEDENDDDRMVS